MKKITVKEAPEIEIQFKDFSYIATFNVRAAQYTQEALEEHEGTPSAAQNAAYILYSGIRVNHPEFTIEEANALVMQMHTQDVSAITEIYYDAMGIDIKEIQETYAKKTMARFTMEKNKKHR